MVTEVVVKESLSSEMISAGAELTRLLDNAGFNVMAALWFYSLELNAWRFIIATPGINDQGPKKAYEQIQSVLNNPHNQVGISLRDISVVDAEDNLISALRVMARVQGIGGIRFS